MMYRYLIALVLVLSVSTHVYCQEISEALQDSLMATEIPELTKKDSTITSYWLAGLGINIVDDSWRARQDYSLSEMWNIVPYPSRLSFGRYFRSGIGLEVIGTYNKFKEGKVIDGSVISEESDYWAIDTRVSYDLNRLVGETGIFDPYIGGGLGYTQTDERRRTLNGVVGFRLWFSDNWGADINTTGKWGLDSESTNHIQHAAGVVYRFGMEKELNKKGLEKAALIEALLAEQQRVADSIQEADELARKLALEEQMRKEAALAAAEKERLEAEKMKKQSLIDEFAGFGKVNFDFNSSFLNTASKESLVKIADFMKRNPNLQFSMGGYADSRGSSEYNIWLSDRRAQSTLKFLEAQGVDQSRISVAGLGESKPLNHCTDGVRCTEKEHAVNRRTEISISSF
jgi:outer membrane protein OmpA-like peptidoglycan-associated protein